jgi:glycosyltransferase involved in cell wall biosynthesis
LKKKKVLQLCHDTKGPFIAICVMYASAFDADEYEVHTAFLRGEPCQDNNNVLLGSKVHFLGLKGSQLRGLKLGAILKVLQLCRQENYQLVIAHRYKPIYIAGIVSLFAQFTLWGVAHTKNVFARLGRRIFVQHWRKNITLIGVSNSVADNILSTCPKLVNSSRVFSLPNCLPEETEHRMLTKSQASHQLITKRDKLNEETYVLGTIGRLVDVKAHDVLLKAYAKSGLKNSLLIIIGSGPKLTELQNLAKALNIYKQVYFAGQIPQALTLLKAFDAFVFSSNDDEAFGVAVLEAMAAKIPVICSDAKGPAEVVGDTGLLFSQNSSEDLADKIRALYELNNEQRQLTAQQGYLRWKNHYTEKPFKTRFSALLTLTENP